MNDSLKVYAVRDRSTGLFFRHKKESVTESKWHGDMFNTYPRRDFAINSFKNFINQGYDTRVREILKRKLKAGDVEVVEFNLKPSGETKVLEPTKKV